MHKHLSWYPSTEPHELWKEAFNTWPQTSCVYPCFLWFCGEGGQNSERISKSVSASEICSRFDFNNILKVNLFMMKDIHFLAKVDGQLIIKFVCGSTLTQVYVPSRSLRSVKPWRPGALTQWGIRSLSRTFKLTVPLWWNELGLDTDSCGSRPLPWTLN